MSPAPAPTLGSPEWFWDSFRRLVRRACTTDVLDNSRAWTREVTAAAVEVCRGLGEGVIVDTETPVEWSTASGGWRPGRLDVSARTPGKPGFTVAFESELAPVGYRGRTHERTWREELEKLAGVRAELRVLSSYFMAGTGPGFNDFLTRQLEDMAPCLRRATPGPWLLVFGSESSSQDPEQPWLPFTLDADLVPRRLALGRIPLRPRRVAWGDDPREE